MDQFELSLFSPSGESWDITSSDWSAGLRAGGIEGMVGVPTDVPIVVPGWPGQVVASQRIPPMEGTLRLAVRGVGAKSAADVRSSIRRALSTRVPSVVLQLRGSSYGTVSAGLRRSGEVSAPRVDPRSEDVILGVDVPVKEDLGFWSTSEVTGQGIVTVTNFGDVDIYPRLTWEGDGGDVIMPSTASFNLPALEDGQRRTLELSPAESMVVLDDDGEVDPVLWKMLRGVVLPEMVPAGQARTYHLPDGATLAWRLGVLDPWH